MQSVKHVLNLTFSQNALIDLLQYVPRSIEAEFIWEVIRCIKWGEENNDEVSLDEFITASHDILLDTLNTTLINQSQGEWREGYPELLPVLTSFVSYGLSSEEIIERLIPLPLQDTPSFTWRLDVKTGIITIVI